MKIRMKHNHQQVREVEEGSVHGFFSPYTWVLRGSLDGQFEVFSSEEWERVPQETWVDVTGSVVTVPGNPGRLDFYNEAGGLKRCMCLPVGIRARKIDGAGYGQKVIVFEELRTS